MCVLAVLLSGQANSIERSAKICEPLDIEVKKPIICGRQIMRDNVEAESGRLL
jgi:hypothetical protein